MMTRRTFLVLLVLGAGSLPGRAAAQGTTDSLTLAEAVHLVLQSHPLLQEAADQIAAAEARVEQRRSGYYPVIDGTGSYSHVAPVPSITLGGDSAFNLYPSNNYDANVALRQLVYDFGRRGAGVDLARAGVEGATEDRAVTESNLAYRTIDTFNAILFLRQSLAIQDQTIAALDEHLVAIRTRVEAGTATDFDALTTEVRLATARSRRSDVANRLQKATVALRDLAGLPPDRPLALRGALEVTAVDLDRDARVTFALANRPEVRRARTVENAAALQGRVAALGNRPQLDVGVMVGVKNGYIPNLNTIKANYLAGVQVSVPIFDGYLTRNAVEESRARQEAAAARTAAIARDVATEVEQAISDVRTSLEKTETTTLQVRQAEQALEMANTRYAAGVVTNLDVLDATTALAEARLLDVEAHLQFALSRSALERAVGSRAW